MDECGAYQFSSASEIVEAFDNELTKIRVRIGKRSAVFAVYNADMEHAQGDCAMARKSGRLFVRPRRSAPRGMCGTAPKSWSIGRRSNRALRLRAGDGGRNKFR